jgi:tRNA U38,U39,U40 pseudouridine synthase TruA
VLTLLLNDAFFCVASFKKSVEGNGLAHAVVRSRKEYTEVAAASRTDLEGVHGVAFVSRMTSQISTCCLTGAAPLPEHTVMRESASSLVTCGV